MFLQNATKKYQSDLEKGCMLADRHEKNMYTHICVTE